MLVEHPSRRPTVFEVLRAVHDMSGTRPEVDYVSVSQRRDLTKANAQPPASRNPSVLPEEVEVADECS